MRLTRFRKIALVLCLSLPVFGCNGDDDDTSDPVDTTEPTVTPDYSLVKVHINELSSDGDDPIELYNPGDAAADISGWIITDELAPGADASTYDPVMDEEELVFAEGTTIAAGAYLVINKGESAGMHPFGLSGDGETVSFFNPDGELAEQVTYGEDEAEDSYCLLDAGWALCEPTFGAVNTARLCGNGTLDDGEVCDGDVGDATCADLEGFTGGTLACADDCASYDTTACELESVPTCAAGVRLNEVCHKDSKCGVEGVTSEDWLELHNTGDAEADISGCYIRITDDDDDATIRLGPVQLASVSGFETATIAAGGYFVIDDNEDLMDAGNNNLVELIGDDGETVINSLITSSAYNGEDDACSIDGDDDTPTPGEANVCAAE